MTHNQIDAILKKKSGKVYITLIHLSCNTVVKQGQFPDTCPWPVVTHWIEKQQMTWPVWHLCRDTREPAVHRGSDASLLTRTSILGHARKGVARVALIVYRIATAGKRERAAWKPFTTAGR